MNMKTLGGYLLFFGAGLIALDFVGMEFILMSWVDHWGPTVGWSMRIGMAVIGGAMWLLAPSPTRAPENAS